MNIVMAPDYRHGNPYQSLLARHLEDAGVPVKFLSHYRRGLPLWRGMRDLDPDLFHLHWPEAYFAPAGDIFDCCRGVRFPLDLWGARRDRPYVATAHNLFPHNRPVSGLVRHCMRAFLHGASTVIVHSRQAPRILQEVHGLDPGRCAYVPHGDLAADFPPLPERGQAIRRLGFGEDVPLVLMFGRVEPYKGVEEVITFWGRTAPRARLVVAGKPACEAYAARIARAASAAPGVSCLLEWCDDSRLGDLFSASDVVVFNYSSIFVSGAALLAKSLGIPVVLPRRLATLELGEPCPGVVRFDSTAAGFMEALQLALRTPRQPSWGTPWHNENAWPHVAALTAQVYRSAAES